MYIQVYNVLRLNFRKPLLTFNYRRKIVTAGARSRLPRHFSSNTHARRCHRYHSLIPWFWIRPRARRANIELTLRRCTLHVPHPPRGNHGTGRVGNVQRRQGFYTIDSAYTRIVFPRPALDYFIYIYIFVCVQLLDRG
jgi:hypothetical protein